MCFYVFAPNKARIIIEYASESIILFAKGKSEVIADMLIRNDSDTLINELNVIYPNQFFKQICDEDDGLIKEGEYEDVTRTIMDTGSQFNWPYKDPHNLMSLRILENTTEELEEATIGLKLLELSQPHPLDPAEIQVYEGFLGGEITITPLDCLTPVQWALLQDIDFSIFKAEFNPPIGAHSSRWVRWRFIGKSAAHNYRRRRPWNLWHLRFTNRLHYEYQVQGSYDVKDRFMETLQFAKARIEKRAVTQHVHSEITELMNYFEMAGLKYPPRDEKYLGVTNVAILDWRLHIRPGRFGRLTDIVMRDDIEIIGGLPNTVYESDKLYPVYEWKSGCNVMATEPGKEYSFALFFQAKESHWIHNYKVFEIVMFLLILILIFYLHS
jgi:hypothetical protein